MVGDWETRRIRRDRMDRKREKRLTTKIQKARALPHREQVNALFSWTKKFRKVSALRAAIRQGLGETK